MTNLHAHVSTSTSDCDGTVNSDYVISLNDDEIEESKQHENDFHEIRFRQRVVASLMSLTGLGGNLRTVCEPGEWITRAIWSEPTEEGGRYNEAIFCEDEDCDPRVTSYRDVYAEEMGY